MMMYKVEHIFDHNSLGDPLLPTILKKVRINQYLPVYE